MGAMADAPARALIARAVRGRGLAGPHLLVLLERGVGERDDVGERPLAAHPRPRISWESERRTPGERFSASGESSRIAPPGHDAPPGDAHHCACAFSDRRNSNLGDEGRQLKDSGCGGSQSAYSASGEREISTTHGGPHVARHWDSDEQSQCWRCASSVTASRGFFRTRRWRMTGGSYSGVLTVAGASIAPRWRRSDGQ